MSNPEPMIRPAARAIERPARWTALLIIGLLATLPGEATAQSAAQSTAPSTGVCRVPVDAQNAPPNPPGVSTEIEVGFYLVDLSRIPNTDQTTTADIAVRLTWRDARLAPADGAAGRVCRFPLSAVWHPRVGILNDRGLRKLLDDTVEVDATGRVRLPQRYAGNVVTPLNLREFPFDQQELSIQLIATRPDEIELVADPALQARADQLSIADWTIGEASTQPGTVNIGPGVAFSTLSISVAAVRDP